MRCCAVRRGGPPPDAYRTLVNDRWKMLARTAYGLTQALYLLPEARKAHCSATIWTTRCVRSFLP